MTQAQYTLFPEQVKFELVPARTKGNAHAYGVLEVPSSNGKTKYRVDVTNGRCSCPAWKFQKGHGKVCKHLKALGFVDKVAQAVAEDLAAGKQVLL